MHRIQCVTFPLSAVCGTSIATGCYCRYFWVSFQIVHYSFPQTHTTVVKEWSQLILASYRKFLWLSFKALLPPAKKYVLNLKSIYFKSRWEKKTTATRRNFQLSFCCFHFKRTTNISNGSQITVEPMYIADVAWSAQPCITLNWIQCKWRLENRNKCKLRLFSPVNMCMLDFVYYIRYSSYRRWKSILNLHFDLVFCRISNGFFLLFFAFATVCDGCWFLVRSNRRQRNR